MKNVTFINLKKTLSLGLICTLVVSCDRTLSDEAVLATYPKAAEVYIDGFSPGLNYYAFGGTKTDAFKVDTEVKYRGTSSMRFDIPNTNDPSGAFAGAAFVDGGRDLSGFDALTFWAKGTQSATINEVGFGNDFGLNKYMVTMSNLSLTTYWQKFTIPIPDPSKLTIEKGMFWYAEGPEEGKGYSFWIDDLQFEKLGTLAHPSPAIFDGIDKTQDTFIGVNATVTGLTQTFNLANGANQTVAVAPGYFTFNSSNPSVATVDEFGVIQVIGTGKSVITATMGGVKALGSLTINSLGAFTPAPPPAALASNVISIFSNGNPIAQNPYTNVPVDYYNGYWAPYQTTQGQDDIHINVNGNIDDIISYTKLNFVGIQFSQPTVNAAQMTHFHIDIQSQEAMQAGDYIKITINDWGADGVYGGNDDTGGTYTIPYSSLANGSWRSFDVPLTSFTGLTGKAHLGQIVIVSDATISNILVDNIYFHK